jgi:hypothetical protein
MQSPYDPNAELSISVPTWIMFPKTPKIRKHARSPLHKVSKATASQIRNNLVRSPSRCHIKAPVFEENHAVNNLNPQTPNMATLTRSTNWEFTPIKLTNDTMVDELACEVRIMKAEVKDLRRK